MRHQTEINLLHRRGTTTAIRNRPWTCPLRKLHVPGRECTGSSLPFCERDAVVHLAYETASLRRARSGIRRGGVDMLDISSQQFCSFSQLLQQLLLLNSSSPLHPFLIHNEDLLRPRLPRRCCRCAASLHPFSRAQCSYHCRKHAPGGAPPGCMCLTVFDSPPSLTRTLELLDFNVPDLRDHLHQFMLQCLPQPIAVGPGHRPLQRAFQSAV